MHNRDGPTEQLFGERFFRGDVHRATTNLQQRELPRTGDSLWWVQLIPSTARKLRPEQKAGTKCAQLEQYGKVCKDHGMALAYDNHTHEFANPRAENRGIVDHSGTYSEYIWKVFGV